MKRITSFVILGALIVNLLSGLAFVSFSVADPALAVEETVIITGDDTAKIPVKITGNPGIWCSQLFILYDKSASFLSVDTADSIFANKSVEFYISDVTLEEAITEFSEFEGLLDASGIRYENAKVVAITSENNALNDIEGDGVFYNLIFDTSLVSAGEYPVDVLCSVFNTLNVEDEKIGFSASNGSLFVVDEIADYCSIRGHEFVSGKRYCLHGCGAENPDYAGGYKVICDGEEIGAYEAGAEVTLPTLELISEADDEAYRFFTWSGADVVRGEYDKNSVSPNGRTYTMIMPESDVTLTAVYSYVGDVNGDKKITTKDLSEIKKLIAGSVATDEEKDNRSDIDGNGKNTTSDIKAIKKLLAGNYVITK